MTCSPVLSKETPHISLTDVTIFGVEFLKLSDAGIPDAGNLNQHLEESYQIKYSVIQNEYIYLLDVQKIWICSVTSGRI